MIVHPTKIPKRSASEVKIVPRKKGNFIYNRQKTVITQVHDFL